MKAKKGYDLYRTYNSYCNKYSSIITVLFAYVWRSVWLANVNSPSSLTSAVRR